MNTPIPKQALTKDIAYERAKHIDNCINNLLSCFPIEHCSTKELYAYLLYIRTIQTTIDIVEQTVLGELELHRVYEQYDKA